LYPALMASPNMMGWLLIFQSSEMRPIIGN